MTYGKWVNVGIIEDLYNQHPYCEYCKITLTPHQASIDHAIPPFRGGSPDSPDNFIICCKDCNYLKGKRTAPEFRLFIVEYAKRVLVNTEPSLGNKEGVEVSGVPH